MPHTAVLELLHQCSVALEWEVKTMQQELDAAHDL